MRISHRTGTYEVHFSTAEQALSAIPKSSFILTDTTVRDLLACHLEGYQVLAVEPGESSKSIEQFGRCLSWLAQKGARRNSHLVALGGGVLGDLAGFVAASYMRGIKYDQIPTTLLAQVDSSVGGKVAVDLPEGKNLVGAFYPPQNVTICTDLLATLSEREFNAGAAEVHKYAFIVEPYLIQTKLEASSPELSRVVRRCVEIKAAIVEADEHETSGRRATLNFGHTVGHALEAEAEYELLHGEAISVGMVVEAILSENLGLAAKGTADTVRERLGVQGLPLTHPLLARESALIEHMKKDKKTLSSALAFSLLTRVGECKLIESVEESAVSQAIAEARGISA